MKDIPELSMTLTPEDVIVVLHSFHQNYDQFQKFMVQQHGLQYFKDCEQNKFYPVDVLVFLVHSYEDYIYVDTESNIYITIHDPNQP
jgi:hypothetical protein